MELRGREGDVFAIVRRVNNIYPREFKVMNPRLAAWMDNGRHGTTHQEVVERLEGVDTTATAERGTGTEAALMTWYRRLGHPPFKTSTKWCERDGHY